MEIYKISIKNKELKDHLRPVYLQEQHTAEAVINTFNSMISPGKALEWKTEIINVLSHEEALEQFIEIGKIFPEGEEGKQTSLKSEDHNFKGYKTTACHNGHIIATNTRPYNSTLKDIIYKALNARQEFDIIKKEGHISLKRNYDDFLEGISILKEHNYLKENDLLKKCLYYISTNDLRDSNIEIVFEYF